MQLRDAFGNPIWTRELGIALYGPSASTRSILHCAQCSSVYQLSKHIM